MQPEHDKPKHDMAKVSYIFIATNGEEYAEDKAWMQHTAVYK